MATSPLENLTPLEQTAAVLRSHEVRIQILEERVAELMSELRSRKYAAPTATVA